MIKSTLYYLEKYLRGWTDGSTPCNRKEFWMTQICVTVVTLLIFTVVYYVSSGISSFGNSMNIPVVASTIPTVITLLSVFILFVINLFCGIQLLCRRFTDIGINVLWVATIFIPMYGPFIPYLISLLPSEGKKFL